MIERGQVWRTIYPRTDRHGRAYLYCYVLDILPRLKKAYVTTCDAAGKIAKGKKRKSRTIALTTLETVYFLVRQKP